MVDNRWSYQIIKNYSNILASAFTGESTDEQPFSTGGESIKERYPIQEYLEVATGILGLTPATFWDLTPREFVSAINGVINKRWKKEITPVTKR